jgi:hypothetical protein
VPLLNQSQRAQPVRIPAPTRAHERAGQEYELYLAERRREHMRSLIRGLIVIGMVVLVVSMARAGLGRVFPPNWWRP